VQESGLAVGVHASTNETATNISTRCLDKCPFFFFAEQWQLALADYNAALGFKPESAGAKQLGLLQAMLTSLQPNQALCEEHILNLC